MHDKLQSQQNQTITLFALFCLFVTIVGFTLLALNSPAKTDTAANENDSTLPWYYNKR